MTNFGKKPFGKLTNPAKNVFLKLSSETTQSERKKVKNKTLLFCPEGSMEC